MNETSLLRKVTELLDGFPDAQEFLLLYSKYVHAIDDVIDEKITDAESVLATFSLAKQVYSCRFYRQHADYLGPLDDLINNTYADSCDWEKSASPMKRRDAGALSHSGIDMFFATILICQGRDELRKVSSAIREITHKLHYENTSAKIEVDLPT